MIDSLDIEAPSVCEQFLRNTLSSAELGFPQAIYDLAQTYISIRNFGEAIAWSRTLAEQPNLVSKAIKLLQQILHHTTDPIIHDEVHLTITELTTLNDKAEAEKRSFLIPEAALSE